MYHDLIWNRIVQTIELNRWIPERAKRMNPIIIELFQNATRFVTKTTHFAVELIRNTQ